MLSPRKFNSSAPICYKTVLIKGFKKLWINKNKCQLHFLYEHQISSKSRSETKTGKLWSWILVLYLLGLVEYEMMDKKLYSVKNCHKGALLGCA